MKKILFSLIVISIPLLAFILFIKQPNKDISVVHPVKSSSLTHKEAPKEKPRIIISQVNEIFPRQPTEEIIKKFDLPQELKAELSKAQEEGKVSTEWGKGMITTEELYQGRLLPAQILHSNLDIRTKNITAGFSVPDFTFAENLSNPFPEKVVEDEQTRILNSEALSEMGFSALLENNYAHAEESFGALIRDYPDTQAAPVVYLELARIVAEKGSISEALQLVDKANAQYGNDKEYAELALGLKAAILTNE